MLDPAHLISMAGRLTGDRAYELEARTRASIGRAYYAVFSAVRAAIRQSEGRAPDDGPPIEHDQLWNALFSPGLPEELGAVGVVLSKLYSARRRADYTFSPLPPWDVKLRDPVTADEYVREARGLLARLPSIDFTPMRGKL